jgi:hypothetical protein
MNAGTSNEVHDGQAGTSSEVQAGEVENSRYSALFRQDRFTAAEFLRYHIDDIPRSGSCQRSSSLTTSTRVSWFYFWGPRPQTATGSGIPGEIRDLDNFLKMDGNLCDLQDAFFNGQASMAS